MDERASLDSDFRQRAALASFGCCVFVGFSALSFVFSIFNELEIRLITWPLTNFPFLCLQIVWSCFRGAFRVIGRLQVEATPCRFCSIWLKVRIEIVVQYTSEFISVLLSAVTISGGEPVLLAAIFARVITLPQACLTDDVVLWIISCSSPFPDFFLPITLIQVDPGST